MTLDDGAGEDGDGMTGELADVVRHSEQHPRPALVLASPHVQPGQRVTVQHLQVGGHLPGHADLVPAQLLVYKEKIVVCEYFC